MKQSIIYFRKSPCLELIALKALTRPSLDENAWISEPTLVNSTGAKHWPGYQHEVYKQSLRH